MKPEVIPFWSKCIRIFYTFIYGLIFPKSIIVDKKTLSKVTRDVKEGRGLLIIFTHFSYRDPIELIRTLILANPVLKERELLNPVAYHQLKKPFAWLTSLGSAWLLPVVTQDTLKKKGYEHLKSGEGLDKFIEKSEHILKKGGIVSLATNAGRREFLDMEDKQRPAGYFILGTQVKGVSKYGILAVSIGLENARSYTKKEAGGINFGKRYIFIPAAYYRLEELLARPEVNGKVGNIDHFLRTKLAEVAPKEYLANYK